MKCEQARTRFSDYLDGVLPDEVHGAVEAHVAECTPCRVELDALRRTVEAVAGLPRHRAPAGFKARVVARARAAVLWRERALAFWPRLAAVAAMFLVAAAIALTAGHAVMTTARPTGEERLAWTPQAPPGGPDRAKDLVKEEALPAERKAPAAVAELSAAVPEAAPASPAVTGRNLESRGMAAKPGEAETRFAAPAAAEPSTAGGGVTRLRREGALDAAGSPDGDLAGAPLLPSRPKGRPPSAVAGEVGKARAARAEPPAALAERVIVVAVDQPALDVAVKVLELARSNQISSGHISMPVSGEGRDEVDVVLYVPAERADALLEQVTRLGRADRSRSREATLSVDARALRAAAGYGMDRAAPPAPKGGAEMEAAARDEAAESRAEGKAPAAAPAPPAGPGGRMDKSLQEVQKTADALKAEAAALRAGEVRLVIRVVRTAPSGE